MDKTNFHQISLRKSPTAFPKDVQGFKCTLLPEKNVEQTIIAHVDTSGLDFNVLLT
jgi:hypothetical protein